MTDSIIKHVYFLKKPFITKNGEIVSSGSSVIAITEYTLKNDGFSASCHAELLREAEEAKSRNEVYVYWKGDGITRTFFVPIDQLNSMYIDKYVRD